MQDLVSCFPGPGAEVPLQAIHAGYADHEVEEVEGGGWFFSKTASADIEKMAARGMLSIVDSGALHTAKLDWSMVNLLAVASGEKLASAPQNATGLAEFCEKMAQQVAAIEAPVAPPPGAPPLAPDAKPLNFDQAEEGRLLTEWKKTGNPAHLSNLLTRYTPLIKSQTRRFEGADVPKAAIDAEAKQIAVQAFKNYDPSRGVRLSTYVTSYLPKVRRYVIKHQNPVRFPEDVALRIGSYRQAEEELSSQLGRSPSAQEIADNRSWSMRDVRKVRMAAAGSSIAEMSDTIQSDDAGRGDRKASIFLDYLYHELDGDEKKVLEHLYGLHGEKKSETTEAISAASGMTVSRVNRLRGVIGDKIKMHLDKV